MFVLWPLTMAASIGALDQRGLLKQLLTDVEDFFRRGATVPQRREPLTKGHMVIGSLFNDD